MIKASNYNDETLVLKYACKQKQDEISTIILLSACSMAVSLLVTQHYYVRNWCMLFRHEICTTLHIRGVDQGLAVFHLEKWTRGGQNNSLDAWLRYIKDWAQSI